MKAKPQFRVKKILQEMEKPSDKQLPKYRKIVEVEYVRKLTFMFGMIHSNDMIEEVEFNIYGRPLELTGPQIYLFAFEKLGSTYHSTPKDKRGETLLEKEILPTLSEFLRRKGRDNEESDTVEQAERDTIEVSNNHTELEEIQKKSHNIHTDDTNAAKTEDAAGTAVSGNSNNHAYTYIAPISVAQLQGQQSQISQMEQPTPTMCQASVTVASRDKSKVPENGPTYEYLEPVNAYRCNLCKCIFYTDTKDTDIAHPCNLRGREFI